MHPTFSAGAEEPTRSTRIALHKADRVREEIWIPCSLEDTSKTKEHASQPRDMDLIMIMVDLVS